MTLLQAIALLLTFAALGAYANHRWLRLPSAIGMTAASVGFSLVLIAMGRAGDLPLDLIRPMVSAFDFQGLVVHGMLAFLLFAGALFVDASALRTWAGPIFSLATVGVVLTALVTGAALWAVAGAMGMPLPLLWACVFGALIAPTDPIAALSIVRGINAPKHVEMKLVGESLFNDGTGVVLFITLLAVVGGHGQTVPGVAITLLRELLGGAALGLVLGWLTFRALETLDAYAVEILLTLALATGSYALAEAIHVSAPIATVVAGLVIGNHARHHAMSVKTREHLDTFWELVDELLNAALFALMVIDFAWTHVALGLVAFVCTLLGRWVGVLLPLAPFGRRITPGTVPVLTWGGLRGGLSLALALSLPPSPYKNLLVTVTFVVVVTSALVQGLTLKGVVRHHLRTDEQAEQDGR